MARANWPSSMYQDEGISVHNRYDCFRTYRTLLMACMPSDVPAQACFRSGARSDRRRPQYRRALCLLYVDPILLEPVTVLRLIPGPMHKRNFSLTSGACLNDDNYSIIAFDVKVDGDDISVLLPDEKDLDSVIATHRWMVKHDTAVALDGGARVKPGSGVEVVGPRDETAAAGCATGCGNSTLDW